MKSQSLLPSTVALLKVSALLCLTAFWLPFGTSAQTNASSTAPSPVRQSGIRVVTNSTAAAVASNAPTASAEAPAPPAQGAPDISSRTNEPGASPDADKEPDQIQLSLQGADINMVVQWLAQNTGKTVIKHPRVMCQVTITSSKKITKREAISLVYRALALEGFTATESSTAILITPEGQEPR